MHFYRETARIVSRPAAVSISYGNSKRFTCVSCRMGLRSKRSSPHPACDRKNRSVKWKFLSSHCGASRQCRPRSLHIIWRMHMFAKLSERLAAKVPSKRRYWRIEAPISVSMERFSCNWAPRSKKAIWVIRVGTIFLARNRRKLQRAVPLSCGPFAPKMPRGN